MYTLGEQADRGLQDFLFYAARETEYYRELISSRKELVDNLKLSDFPLLTRHTVQRERSHFLCGRYQRYPDIEYVLMKRSFGFSGIPLEIYWDSRDDSRSQACLWEYRKKRFGITQDEKCCVFRTAEYAGNKIMDNMPKRLSGDGKTLSFSIRNMSPERLQWCMDTIQEFAPAWMSLSPSIALMLAENMAANRRTPWPGLRYIELCGEMLNAETQTIIRDTFQVQTGNVYASQAMGAIAASCEYGHLHIFQENVVVEAIRDGKPVMDEEGDIYITSLQNTAMPLIRMETEDRGVLQTEPCPCGQPAPVLRLSQGRKPGFITTESGRKVSAHVLRSMAEYTNEEISRCMAHIRFRQNDNGHMDAVLGVKPAFYGWKKETARIFKERIEDSELRQMQWNFIFTNLCESDDTEIGVHPFFESREGEEQ